MEQKTEEKMIDVSQAARRLNVSESTIYRMLEDGRLGGLCMKGRTSKKGTWKVSEESIEMLKKESRVLSINEEKKTIKQLSLFEAVC